MRTRCETPTRERWLEILSQCAPLEGWEHRRNCPRRHIELGMVKLTFEEGGAPVVRTGSLLNASDSGLMVKQHKEIPCYTKVQIELTVGDEVLALTGRVAHATQTVSGFKVGIELQFPDRQD